MSKKTTVRYPDISEKEKQLLNFYIGLEILGEKKKERFLLYLLSLQKPHQPNQETKENELQDSAA